MCLDQAAGFRAKPAGGPRLWQAPATQPCSERTGDFKGEIYPAAPNTKLSCCYNRRRSKERQGAPGKPRTKVFSKLGHSAPEAQRQGEVCVTVK